MPMPSTYSHATREWRAFLNDAKDQMNLISDNSTYTAIDGVFRVFRRRLTPDQGIRFASVLPSVPRAIFIFNWDVMQPPVAFSIRHDMTREAQALRPHHNLTPDNAIEAVAYAVRRSVLPAALDRALDACPPQAHAFWHVDADPSELGPRIV